jgi:hypothetical protein
LFDPPLLRRDPFQYFADGFDIKIGFSRSESSRNLSHAAAITVQAIHGAGMPIDCPTVAQHGHLSSHGFHGGGRIDARDCSTLVQGL